MNWTGGQRQRHSNAPDSLRLRQKQHFARVRATRLSGKQRSRPKPPNIDRLRALHEGNSQLSESQDFSQRDKTPFQLQNFTSSLENRRSSYYEEVQQQPNPSSLKQKTPATGHPKKESDEGLYDAAPQSRRKREREISRPLQHRSMQGSEDESLSEKRRKILRKGDWVSVGFQRAPQLKFPSRNEESQVAKRRVLADDHRSRHVEKMYNPLESLVSGNYYPQPFPDVNKPEKKQGRTDVKIWIEGKVIPPGISSSSAQSKHSRSLRGAEPSRRTSKSSDIMLLDNLQRTPVQPRVAVEEYCRGYARNGSAIQSFFENPGVLPSSNIGSTACPGSVEKQEPLQPRFTSSSDSPLLHHPKPQSSKVSSILRSTSTPIAESMVANVGRLKAVNLASQLGDTGLWEAWMDWIVPNYAFDGSNAVYGGSVDDHNRTVSPGISATPTYGFGYEDVMDSANNSETGKLSPLESPQFETSAMPEEEEGVKEKETGETLQSEAGSDIIDDIFGHPEVLELSTQPEESISEGLSSSPQVPRATFKNLSPIPEVVAVAEELLKKNQYSPTKASPNGDDHSVSDSPLNLQQEQSQTNVQGFKYKGTGAQANFIQTWNTSSDDPFEVPPIEQAIGDELWRRFVFGSDSEEFDIFHNDVSRLETPDLEQSIMPSGSQDIPMFVSSMQDTGTDSTLPSIGYTDPKPDFISQLMKGASQNKIWTELDTAVPRTVVVDLHSTAGNATSMAISSSYFSSSPSIFSPASEVAPTDEAQNGSTTHSLYDTVSTRPKKRVMFTKPTSFIVGVSPSAPSQSCV